MARFRYPRDVKLVAHIYRAGHADWAWKLMDRHNKTVLAQSAGEFRKLADVRGNFETVTGLDAPAVGVGKNMSTAVYHTGLRSHTVTYPFKRKDKSHEKTASSDPVSRRKPGLSSYRNPDLESSNN
jgi:hypothetical protein